MPVIFAFMTSYLLLTDEFPFEPKEVEVNTTVMFEDVYEVDQEVGK